MSQVQAARVTDVADAADTILIGDTEQDDPFDLYVFADFDSQWSTGNILREPSDLTGAVTQCAATERAECTPVKELTFKRAVQTMRLGLEIGIFHDLALTMELPIIFASKNTFDYAKKVTSATTSIDPATGTTLFAHNLVTNRKGVGAMKLGFRWAPLSDERDETKPMWVVYFNWAMPYTAAVHDPETSPGTAANPGSMGDGLHRLTFGTAVSKRIGNFGLIGIDRNINRRGYTDPYIDLSYTLPLANKSGSRRAKNALIGSADDPFGGSISHTARIAAGFEFIPYEDLKKYRQVAIDIGFRGLFTTEGRNYDNELMDALGEIPFSEQHFRIGGALNAYVQPLKYMRIKIGFSISYVTEHFLTFETAGKDVNGDGNVQTTAQNPNTTDITNPYFAPYDNNGSRLKSANTVVYGLTTGLQVTF